MNLFAKKDKNESIKEEIVPPQPTETIEAEMSLKDDQEQQRDLNVVQFISVEQTAQMSLLDSHNLEQNVLMNVLFELRKLNSELQK
jgi:hypothetical protein